MKPTSLLLAALTFSGLSLATSQAQTPALTSISGGGETSYSGSVGFEFTLSADETLVSLGRYDFNTTSEEVGIYDLSGDLLAMASVGGPGTPTGQYVFSSAVTDSSGTPITLTLLANTDYVIGTSGAESYYDDGTPSPTVSSAVTLVASRYSVASGFAFPDTNDHVASGPYGLAYTGPNFEYSAPGAATPEPSAWALLGTGGVALLLVGRQRSRRA